MRRHLLWIPALALALAAGLVSATVTTTATSVSIACDGGTRTATIPFRYQGAGTLVVTETAADAGADGGTTLTLGTDYTLPVDGGTILSLTSACPAGSTLTVSRSTPKTQLTPFSTQGPFSPKAHEAALDKLELQIQELASKAWTASTPTITSCTVSSSAVSAGEPVTYTCNVNDRASYAGCIFSDDLGTSADCTATGSFTQTTAPTCTALSAGGTATKACDTVNIVYTPVIATFTADATVVSTGSTVTFTWSAQNVTGLSLQLASSGAVVCGSEASGDAGTGYGTVSGSCAIAVDATATYELVASNYWGVTATRDITVTAVNTPTVTTFTALPSSIASGSPVTLTWVTTDATSISIAGNGTTVYTSTSGSGTTTLYPTASTSYTLTATNAAGDSVTATAADVSVLPSPTSVSALSISTSAITVSFEGSASASSFTVQRSTSSSSGFADVGTVTSGSTSNTYSDTGLSAGTTYYYRVLAVDSLGSSTSASSVAHAITYPATPAGVAATTVSTSSIALAWTASTGASSYTVYRSTTSGSGFTAIGATTSASYTDTSLSSGTTYYYRVVASIVDGQTTHTSALSSEVSALTHSAAPATVTATSGGTSSIALAWTASTGAATYSIYRSTASSSGFASIAATSDISYTDTSPASGTTYYYYVVAVNSAGSSGGSVSSTVSALTYPAAVTNLVATATSSSTASVSWTASTGATYYSVTPFGLSTTTVTGTSTTLTGLSANTSYSVTVIACNASGCYGTAVGMLTYPGAPTSVSASPTSTSTVTVAWTAPTGGADSYTVYRSSTSSSSGFALVGTATSTTYSDTGLSSGTTYYYYVHAINTTGASASSSVVSALTYPAAPANLAATATSASAIALTWTASTGAASYTVLRSTDGSTYSTLATTTSVGYTDTSCADNTTYYYEVTATNASATSAASSSASALTYPGAPTSPVATSVSSSAITLTWTAPTGGAVSYTVYRSTSSSSGFASVATPTAATYSDTTLSAATTYYYYVVANNATGTGAATSTVSATTRTSTPSGLSVTAKTASTASVAWTAVTGAASYTIYRSTTSGSSYSSIATTTTNSYTASSLTSGTTYYFEVTATNAGGESTASSEASVMTPEWLVRFDQLTPGCIDPSTVDSALSVTTSGGSAAYDGGVVEFCAANKLRIWDAPYNRTGLAVEDGTSSSSIVNPASSGTLNFLPGIKGPSIDIGPFDTGSVTLVGSSGWDAGYRTQRIGAAAYLDAGNYGTATVTAQDPLQGSYFDDGGTLAYVVSGTVTHLQEDDYARPHTPIAPDGGIHNGDIVELTYTVPTAFCLDFTAVIPYAWAPGGDTNLLFVGDNGLWSSNSLQLAPGYWGLCLGVYDSTGTTKQPACLHPFPDGPSRGSVEFNALAHGVNRYGSNKGNPPRITVCGDWSAGTWSLYWDGYAAASVVNSNGAGSGTGTWSSAPTYIGIGGYWYYLMQGFIRNFALGASSDPTGRFFTPGTDHKVMLLGGNELARTLALTTGSSSMSDLQGMLPAYTLTSGSSVPSSTSSNKYSDQILTAWTSTDRATAKNILLYLPPEEDIIYGPSSGALTSSTCTGDATTIASNISTVVSQAVTDGAKVVLATIPPFGTTTPSSNASSCTAAQRETVRQAVNTTLKALASTSITVVNLDATFADSSSPPAIKSPFVGSSAYLFSNAGHSVLLDLLAGAVP